MAARFTRPVTCLVALIFVIAADEATAQSRPPNFQGILQRSPLSTGPTESRYSPSYSQTPNTYEQARQPYIAAAPYSYDSPSCNPQREAMLRRAAMMQARRSIEEARRKAAREKLPDPLFVLTEEQQAASKFQVAHLLWLKGNVPAAQRWLDEILDKYPRTDTAERAKSALAKL